MQDKLTRMALRTSAVYGLFAALWILLSDRALVALVSDPHTIGRLSIYKGWAFVAVTGLLLYGTLRTQSQRWQREVSERMRAEESLRTNEMRLSEAADMARLAYWEADGKTGPREGLKGRWEAMASTTSARAMILASRST